MNRAHQTGRSENGIYRVAIVGAGTLKGKELGEVLPETSFPAVDIKLLDDDESLGQIEAVGEEVTFVQSVRPENFENVDFTFFTSQPEFTILPVALLERYTRRGNLIVGWYEKLKWNKI